MILNLFSLYFILLLCICSFIGYGSILKDRQKNLNVFNYFFIGLVIFNIIAFVYYLLLPNNKILNLLIIFFGVVLYFKNLKFENIKLIILITLIFFSGLIISKTHEDFSVYHYQHIKELTDSYLKFGLANLDNRYFYASIFSYIQTIFRLPYYELYFVHVPIYSIYLALIGYLTSQIINLKKKYINFVYFFFLLLLIAKFKRLSEYGYDYIGQFILIYIFLEFVLNKNSLKSVNKKVDGLVIFFYTVLIKISNFYFFPILVFNYFNSRKDIFHLILKKKIVFFTSLLILVFSINSFLKTGCFNYLIEFSCLSKMKTSWVYDYKDIENTKKLSKSWSRGYFHQDEENKVSEIVYNSNFYWIKNWIKTHFNSKILPFVLINILIVLISKYFAKNKKKYQHNVSKLLLSVIFSNLIWLYFFPQFRFGFAGISILICVIFIKYGEVLFKLNLRKFLFFLTIFIIYFNASNINRIYKEYNREDLYKFTNFPLFALPSLNFDYQIKNIRFNRSKKNDNFWRTCFNSNLICVNHDEIIKFNKNKRYLFISK